MTDREKLIELIDEARDKRGKICSAHPTCDECPAFKDGDSCHDGILADHLIANGVTIQQWIPVTEMLPENLENVLVRTWGVMIGWYDCECLRWRSDYFTFNKNEVTHWMPLPEPPKGE